jgi:hypothetical protein
MSNRAARRKAAKASSLSPSPSPASSIPLAQPTRRTPEGKTLLDLAAERQASFNSNSSGNPFSADEVEDIDWKDLDNIPSSRKNQPRKDEAIDEPIGRFGQALFYTISLIMLHFTLDVLAHNQYRQDIDWRLISQTTATAFLRMLSSFFFFFLSFVSPFFEVRGFG